MKFRLLITLTATCLGCGYTWGDQLADARNLVERWVQVEEAISQEKVAWLEKEAALQDLIKLAELEMQTLEEEQTRLAAESNKTNETRLALREDEMAAKERLTRVREFLATVEARIKPLEKSLPAPLQESLQPLFLRIPESASETRMGAAERMQTVVTIMSRMFEFDDRVVVDSEIREVTNGGKNELTTLWVGLGAAYYIDEASGDAGYGVVSREGWNWVSEPELRQEIMQAIELATGRDQDARFIALPFELGQL